jgi:manganese transport protein
LKQYRETLSAQGYKTEIKLGYGNPKKVIPQLVNEYAPDLLVMGAHGHNTFKDLIFGTTLNTVRHRVSAPLLIVNAL